MININELESRWLNYKIKLFLPYVLIFVSVVVIFLILYFYFASTAEINIETNSVKIDLKNKIVSETKVQIQNKEIKIDKKEMAVVEKTVLMPSLNFMNKNSINSIPDYREIEEIYFNPSKKKIEKKIEIIEPLVENIKKEKNGGVVISRKNTKSDIEHVKKRFQKSNNPALSLFIAKKYYELGKYNQAYNYALLTNEINNEIDASWIIFAKSLVKLGKKDKAITMLKKYINHSNSNSARILLDNITSGKLK